VVLARKRIEIRSYLLKSGLCGRTVAAASPGTAGKGGDRPSLTRYVDLNSVVLWIACVHNFRHLGIFPFIAT